MRHFYHFHPKNNTFPGYGKQGARYGVISTVRGTRSAQSDSMPIGSASLKIFGRYHDITDIYFTNLIKEPHAFGKKPYVKFIREYMPTLMTELEFIFHAEVEGVRKTGETIPRILVMGAVLAQHLCPGFKDLNADRGSFFFNPSLNAHVIPTYHFGSVMHSPRMKEWMKRDLERFFTLPDPVKPKFYSFTIGKAGESSFLPPENELLFLDIETASTTDDDKGALDVEIAKIISIGIKNPNSEVYILENPTTIELTKMHRYIRDNNITIVGHNLSFDLAMLSWRSDELWDDVKVIDTMLMAYIEGHTNKSLKHLTTFLTNRPGSRGLGGTTDLVYLAEDVISTEAVFNHFYPLVKDKYAYGLLNELVPMFIGMRQTGVAIDNKLFNKILPEMVSEVQGMLDALQKKYAFGEEINWNANKQVAARMLSHHVPLHEYTPTGQVKVTADILEELKDGHKIVSDLLQYREQTKVLAFLESYNGFMQYDGRLHPILMLDGAETGRLACRYPNLQQVKKTGIIKKLFISQFKGGSIGLVDLAQAELRIAAFLSGDIGFANALNTQDVHRYIASLVFDKPMEEIDSLQRNAAKTIAFGLLYGGGAVGLAGRLNVPVLDVQRVIDIFFSQFPTLMHWIAYLKAVAVQDKQSITLFGRVRDYRDAYCFQGIAAVERQGINTPVQGTASDVMLIIMVKFYNLCVAGGLHSRPTLGVHDSTVIDIYPGEEETVAQYLGQAFISVGDSPLSELKLWKILPIEGELSIGKTWAHTESTSEFFAPDSMYKLSSHAPVEKIDKSHYTA